MPRKIDALQGRDGMVALLAAFYRASSEFHLGVIVAAPVEGSGGYHLLFQIGGVTAAMSIAETQWLADRLIYQSAELGPLSADLQSFGRVMLSVLADAPGPHGLH